MSTTCPEMGPVGSYIYQQDFHSSAANHLSQHYLFTYFGCADPTLLIYVFAAAQAFSSCGEQGPLSRALQASHCCDFSYRGTQASVAVVPGLRCSKACGIFLCEGIKPVSLALAGRFFSTEPPRKP